ncbi:beta-1,4-mannosyl-glycoprotein 4-beta-N-acetylglucosaminyltransferase-like [Penaeus japonicus]|uniref:beta-1,4-mannosyl-glycoprotein 4-beta-N-acetylglucosaminyltransferase-like n=1 Tax=Penaeus japonicus TaxID=27405 RepID=UPI001C7127CA|nr:beta-1,4-mannosyl-glycoprotein 4-beta-N-acetylglucosaminyltransferase-like [Penaeus japonicus]
MRVWRRLRAEWRRKRSWREGAVVLAFVQMIIFVSLLTSWAPSQNPELPEESMQRVGNFFIFFTTAADPPDHPWGGDEGAGTGMGKGRAKNADKNANANEAPPVKQEDENDPVVGRGFQDEYVTYRSSYEDLQQGDEEEGNLERPMSDTEEREKPSHQENKGEERVKDEDDSPVRDNVIIGEGDLGIPLPETIDKSLKSDRDSNNTFQALSSSRDYKFKKYNISNPEELLMVDDTRHYFSDLGGMTCFTEGTNIEKTKLRSKKCYCHKHYFGEDCGIPEAVWYGRYKFLYPDTRLRRRTVPRRVVNGLPVNHEFAMFEARMHELYDVVDVFLVAESNYTAHGDLKRLEFFTKFQQGYLSDFQDKLVYINLGFFSSDAKKSGWIADAYLRYYMGTKGLPLLKGLRDDDLFVLSDADEIPTREVIAFLKLYDGYSEPIAFGLRWNVFSFAWKMPSDNSFWNWISGEKEKLTVVNSAATVGMLRRVLLNNTFYIRKKDVWKNQKLSEALEKYQKEGHLVKDWVAGTIGHYAGWHCSWCFSPPNIIKKMDSAQANDKPRWGDYPEKKNIAYITSRLWEGRWFDDKLQLLRVKDSGQRFYAPKYFLENPDLYRSLLYHPGHERNFNQTWKPP